MKFQKIILIISFVLGCHSASAEDVLTWQDCLREATKNHPDLIVAQEQVIQEKEAKTITASDAFPQVSADASATAGQSESSGAGNNFSYGVSGSQLLFDGLRTPNLIRSSQENIKAAQENFKFTSSAIRLRLREAFVNLLKTQELLKLTEEIYKIRRDNLELINLRYESGTEHKGALLTAKANLSQADYEINQAKRNVSVAQHQLNKELGREEFAPLTVKSDFDVSATADEPNFDQLVKSHPSVLRLTAQKNAALFNVKADKGNLWPAVILNGDLGKSDSQWPPKDKGSSAGVRVSLPIFEGGLRQAQIAQSQSVYREREQEERSIKDEVSVNLRQSFSDFQDAVETVGVQRNFLNAAEERSKIAEQQYSVGLITFDNWTIIQDDLVRNKKEFLNAQTNALLAQANWVNAKGETLEYEN